MKRSRMPLNMYQFMKAGMPESGKIKCELCGKEYAYYTEMEDNEGNFIEAQLYCSACMQTIAEIEILPPVKGCMHTACSEK